MLNAVKRSRILFWVRAVGVDLLIWSVVWLRCVSSPQLTGPCLDPDKSGAAVCSVDYPSQNQISSISKAKIGARWKSIGTYKERSRIWQCDPKIRDIIKEALYSRNHINKRDYVSTIVLWGREMILLLALHETDCNHYNREYREMLCERKILY